MSSSIKLAKALPPRSRTVQGTYQLSATLGSEIIAAADKRFEEARSIVLRWMGRRLSRELARRIPPPAWTGNSFEIDQHGQMYGAVTVTDLDLWVCRMEHDDSSVAARTWSVDVALRKVGSEVILIERTLCISLTTCVELVPLNVPRVIRDVIARVGLNDVIPISGKPWRLETVAELDTLEQFLASAARTLPVVMLTEPEPQGTRTYKVARFVLDPITAAKDLEGLAHVVVMPRGLGFDWTRKVGRPWSAFNGAIRTYRPGLNFANDDAYRHPLAKLDEIVLWEYQGVLSSKKLLGEEAFQAFLKEKAFHTVASRPLRQEETLFYRYAKARALSEAAAQQVGRAGVEEELKLEIDELRKQLDEERGEKDYVYNYSAELEESVQRLEKERFSLRAQLDILRSGLGQEARKQVPIPESLEDLEDWQNNVAGQLWIAPKAIGAAGKSEFKNPTLVYEAILLLANEYRQMRINGGQEYKTSYQEGLMRLKLTEARSISESRVGEQGDEYYVNHPFQPGKRILLEEHLRRGSDRDPRNTLRIYFAWEPQEQLVVVGWLPSHLTTRNT